MKYKLTDETKNLDEVILHRIECVEAFADVKIGDKGGWIEKESNLSQTGNAWVYDNAQVYDNARVYDNAQVWGDAQVYGNARVYDDSTVLDHALVYGEAALYDMVRVSDYAEVYGNAQIYFDAEVCGYARVYDEALVFNDAQVMGNACVGGNAQVIDHACVKGDAKIFKISDYMVFKKTFLHESPSTSELFFTWTRSNNMWATDDFYGTDEELIEKAKYDSDVMAKFFALHVKLVEDLKRIENNMENILEKTVKSNGNIDLNELSWKQLIALLNAWNSDFAKNENASFSEMVKRCYKPITWHEDANIIYLHKDNRRTTMISYTFCHFDEEEDKLIHDLLAKQLK